MVIQTPRTAGSQGGTGVSGVSEVVRPRGGGGSGSTRRRSKASSSGGGASNVLNVRSMLQHMEAVRAATSLSVELFDVYVLFCNNII